MNNLSTLTEVSLRGKIIDIFPSTLREDTLIVIFADGSQCNINNEVYKQLKQ